MTGLISSAAVCFGRIKKILDDARCRALRSVNAAMVAAYWHVGREIVEEEQKGKERAEYGEKLIERVSERLTVEFGKGFSCRNLRQMRRFYLTYSDRLSPIWQPLIATLKDKGKSNAERRTTRHDLVDSEVLSLRPELTWTHYQILLRIRTLQSRSFYEVECARAGWSVRELQRQINSFLFERLAASRDKEGVLALARQGHEVQTPADLVKDPYVLEFVGLPESARLQESDLETALIDHLQQFLQELGRDLYFVARQKRITIDGDHFYIDLVFYHRILRCFLIIDLKLG